MGPSCGVAVPLPPAQDHLEIGEPMGLFDFESGGKVSGQKFLHRPRLLSLERVHGGGGNKLRPLTLLRYVFEARGTSAVCNTWTSICGFRVAWF